MHGFWGHAVGYSVADVHILQNVTTHRGHSVDGDPYQEVRLAACVFPSMFLMLVEFVTSEDNIKEVRERLSVVFLFFTNILFQHSRAHSKPSALHSRPSAWMNEHKHSNCKAVVSHSVMSCLYGKINEGM